MVLIYQSLYISAENTNTGSILSSLRNDDVCIALGWFDKLFVHWLEHLQLTIYHHGNRTPPIDGITLDVTDQALISICIHKHLQVHQIT